MSGPQVWGAPEGSAALAKEGVGQGRNLLEAELRGSGHPEVRVQEKEVSPHPGFQSALGRALFQTQGGLDQGCFWFLAVTVSHFVGTLGLGGLSERGKAFNHGLGSGDQPELVFLGVSPHPPHLPCTDVSRETSVHMAQGAGEPCSCLRDTDLEGSGVCVGPGCPPALHTAVSYGLVGTLEKKDVNLPK